MADGLSLKDRLDLAVIDADAAMERIAGEGMSRDEFRSDVRAFTLAKFFLTRDEYEAEGTDDLLELANASVEKMLRNADKSVKLAEGSTTCTNQSSTDIKKVLLSLTLQRALGVKFPPEYAANLETVEQLADALYDARGKAEFAR